MLWYPALIAVVALLRLLELAWSARNARRLRARGGVEAGAGHYPAMVAVHAGFLVSAPLEVILAGRPFVPALGLPMLALFAATMALRYWVIATLGDRWCTRVIVPPGGALVTSGPYRLMRHPNYLAVAIEIPALALVHSAWLSALVFGTLNGLLLRTRIRVEETALGRDAGVAPRGRAR
jgi:methyltransferase